MYVDRADEALEEAAAEESPTPAQQRQLLRARGNLGHPPTGEFCRDLRKGLCPRGVVHWVKRHFRCLESEARPMPRDRPAAASPSVTDSTRFVASTPWTSGIRWTDNTRTNVSYVICFGTHYHHGGTTT